MKGLLLKDLYQFIRKFWFNIIINLAIIVIGFLSKKLGPIMIMAIWNSAFFPITLLHADEGSGWTEYSLTLPYNEKQIVSAKYLFGLIGQSVISVIVLAALIVWGIIYGETDISGSVTTVVSAFAASLMYPAICLPFCFKFGADKGSEAYFILSMLLMVIVVLLFNDYSFDNIDLSAVGNKMLLPCIVITPLYAISWLVSVPMLKSAKR